MKVFGSGDVRRVSEALERWLDQNRQRGHMASNNAVCAWVLILSGKVSRSRSWDEMLDTCTRTISLLSAIGKGDIRDEVEVVLDWALGQVRERAA